MSACSSQHPQKLKGDGYNNPPDHCVIKQHNKADHFDGIRRCCFCHMRSHRACNKRPDQCTKFLSFLYMPLSVVCRLLPRKVRAFAICHPSYAASRSHLLGFFCDQFISRFGHPLDFDFWVGGKCAKPQGVIGLLSLTGVSAVLQHIHFVYAQKLERSMAYNNYASGYKALLGNKAEIIFCLSGGALGSQLF